MNVKEKSITLEFSIRWFIGLFLMVSLIALLSIPLALARETRAPVIAKGQIRSAVSTTTAPKSEKGMTQTPDPYTANNSIAFLMEKPPLTQSTTLDAASPALAPGTTLATHAVHAPVTLQVLQGRVLEEADEVAMLVKEKCSQSGDAAEGTSSCERVFSNNHRVTVITRNANEGDETKSQTVSEEFDSDNNLLARTTIRRRVDYNYLNDRKAKWKELFDIIHQPTGRKTTRELMVYEYFLDTGKAKSLTWTQYKQIGNEPKAELVFHTLLRYGDDGSPDRGLAERWDHGKKAETYMNWSRRSKGFATLDDETWGQVESHMLSVSMKAYLP